MELRIYQNKHISWITNQKLLWKSSLIVTLRSLVSLIWWKVVNHSHRYSLARYIWISSSKRVLYIILMISFLQNQIKRRLNTMDQCQAETGTRWSTTRPSPWGAWCLPGPGPRAVSPSPAWSATQPPGSASPWPTGQGRAELFTPPTVTPRPPPPSPPGLRVNTATSGRSASAHGPPGTTGQLVRVSLGQEEGRKPGGYSAITWGAGRPPPPPPRPLNRATLSAPPQARLITALSFLTHFPTRDQLVFQ